jgi:hypothetical protein
MTSSQPDSLDDLMPADPIMAGAWVASLSYAFSRDDIMAAFRNDTGNTWTLAKTPIDKMIDEATSADLAFLRAFAKWHNENIWGEENGKPVDAPPSRLGGEPV